MEKNKCILVVCIYKLEQLRQSLFVFQSVFKPLHGKDLADTFVRKVCFFLHQTCSKRDVKKRWLTLFIITLVLLGLSTQFKNWYIV